MSFKQQFDKFYEEYEQIKIENKALKRQLAQQEHDFEELLNQTKKSFKIQHKNHVRKYEMKIQELTARLKNVLRNGSDKENRTPVRPIEQTSKQSEVPESKTHALVDLTATEHSKSKSRPIVPHTRSTSDFGPAKPESSPAKPWGGLGKSDFNPAKNGAKLKTISTLPPPESNIISSSPVKSGQFDLLPTQYSSDSEVSQIEKIQPHNLAGNVAKGVAGGVASDSAADLPPFDLHKLTPLQQREALNNYYTEKFHNNPKFKINLDINPLTRKQWVVNDFENVDIGDDTPPYMFIKDNTSQEDKEKQEYYIRSQRQLVITSLKQCLNGDNKFIYGILNRYVEYNRFSIRIKPETKE